jgi:PAS domain S-box-containing protein
MENESVSCSNRGIGQSQREDKERLLIHLENSPLAVVEWDQDFIVTRWAGEAENIFGWRAAETVGRPVMDLHMIYDEDIPIVQKTMERLTGGTSRYVVLSNRNYTKDGRVIYCTWYNSIVHDKHGRMSSVLSFVLDNTDLVQTQKTLLESEKRYRSYIEVTNQIAWTTDANGVVIEDLPTWRKFTGQTFEEIKGWGWSNALHPDDLARTEKVWNESVAQKSSYETEYRMRRFDGVYRYFLARGIPVFKEDGTIEEWVGTCIDITERKKMEEALQKSREDLAHAQAVGSIGSWRLDIQKNVLTWSDENYRIFGIPKGTALTYEIFLSTIHPDDRAFVDSKWKAGLEGKGYDIEHRIVVDRKIKWVREKACLEFDNNNKLLGGFGIAQDITYKKRTEEALRKAHDRLEARVRERTVELRVANEALQAEIAERKRIDEEKRAIKAQMLRAQRMESIGTLAAGIAHDFNNILTPIMLNTTAALMDLPENSPVRKYLEHTLTSSNRAKDLVQQILTFSRKGKYDLKLLKFEEIITEALKLIRSSIPSTIEIRMRIDPCGPILADTTQMHQIVMNLCTNAHQAMREGAGILEIALEEVDVDAEFAKHNMHLKPARYLRFMVKDSGYGMEQATMERIFDPFFTTKETAGTGLGLSVVQGIVFSHGGAIDVQSQPGIGTTFYVYLPRAIEEDKQAEKRREEGVLPGKESILFVDDEVDIAFMGKEMLERFGYNVVEKTDSAEALDEFRANSEKYDIVITDYAMPRMNGLELARALKKIRSDIVIVLTSGFNETVTPVTQLSISEINASIKKPYSMGDLIGVIRNVMKHK